MLSASTGCRKNLHRPPTSLMLIVSVYLGYMKLTAGWLTGQGGQLHPVTRARS